MKEFLKISLMLSIVFLFSCKEKTIKVKSENIDNFSNINYIEAENYPYFSEIKSLPIGFSLGDFSDHNSILYLTESANIFPIDDENLQYFLTNEELQSAFETYLEPTFHPPFIRKVQFYPYERLVTKNYVLLFINKRQNYSNGRDYEFYIRTYTFEGQIIDNFSIAKWDEEKDMYYGGWIMPDMMVKREYRNGEIEHFEINEAGKILTTKD